MADEGKVDLSAPEVLEAIEKAKVEAVAAVDRKNKELLGELKPLRDKVKALPEDFDPDRWKALTAAEQDRERKKAEEAGEFKKLEAQLGEQHAKKETAWQTERTQLVGALESEMVDARAVEAITAAEGSPKLLLPHVKASARVVWTDGRARVVIVGEDGKTPLLRKEAKDAGDLMTIKDFVLSLRESEEFAGAFRGTGSTGSGAPNTSGGAARGTTTDPAELGRLANQEYQRRRKEAAGV